MAYAATILLEAVQGDTYLQNFIYKDDTQTPVDMTGWTAKMQIKQCAADEDPVLELTTENGRITLGNAGQINLAISAISTQDLPLGSFFYDFRRIDNSGNVRKLFEGSFLISRAITQL